MYSVNNLASIGVVSDVVGELLPPAAFTSAMNMRFRNGVVERCLGIFSVFGTPVVSPYYAELIQTPSQQYWIYLGGNKAYVYEGGTHTNITRQESGSDVNYNMPTTGKWTGGCISGLGVFNNENDIPQAWLTPTASQRLVNLPNWPADVKCKSLRVFKQFLIAMDVTKGSIRYPHMVKWSHPAEPGTVPESWDETDPTKLAGESPKLAETSGFVVDGLAMRDSFILYKEDSVWRMQLINVGDVFRIEKIFSTGGIMAQNCAVEYSNGMHAVFGVNDLYIHDGQQMKSIIAERMRETLFNRINADAFYACFTALSESTSEILFAYPTGENLVATEALVWNYDNNTISFRELPYLSHIAYGRIVPESASVSDQYDGDNEAYDSDNTSYAQRLYTPGARQMLGVSPINTKLYRMEYGYDFTGMPSGNNTIVERIALPLPASGDQSPDISTTKFLSRVWVRISGEPGTVVKVQLGVHDTEYSVVEWLDVSDFIVGVSKFVDWRVSGRMFALRFFSEESKYWRVQGYGFDYKTIGGF